MKLYPLDHENNDIITILYETRNHDNNTTFLTKSRIKGETKSALKELIKNKQNSDNFYYGLHVNETFVGTTQAIWWDKISSVVEVGIMILPQHRKRGYATEALTLLESRLSAHFRVRKFIARIRKDNFASIKVFENISYKKVGTLKKHYYHQNMFHDIILFEKLIENEN